MPVWSADNTEITITQTKEIVLIKWRTKFNTTHQVNSDQLSRDKRTRSVFSLEYYYDTANCGHHHHDTRSTVLSTSAPDSSLHNVPSIDHVAKSVPKCTPAKNRIDYTIPRLEYAIRNYFQVLISKGLS